MERIRAELHRLLRELEQEHDKLGELPHGRRTERILSFRRGRRTCCANMIGRLEAILRGSDDG